MTTCVIIPVYNHDRALPKVLKQLKPYGLPCLLVDDGSYAQCKSVISECTKDNLNWLTVLTRQKNGGKGAAVMDGFRVAIEQGFHHALQIDADGQHDVNAIPQFLAASKEHPETMILGKPVFDASIPKSRLYGRQITNFWIKINTLSNNIEDGMCGFRLYPLYAIKQLTGTKILAKRMDFDIEIVVRLFWQGVDCINLPVNVSYPKDGISHFRLWQDNFLISLTHTRLFFSMLPRIPRLLSRHYS